MGASSTGLAVSMLLHTIITLLAAVFTVGVAGAGGGRGGSGGNDFELTVTSEVQLSGLGDAEIPESAVAMPSAELPELPTSGILDGAGGIDAPAAGAGVGQIADGLGGAGGGNVGDGAGLGSSGAGTGRGAGFFGLEAKGNRFAYICDTSGSMNMDAQGAPNGMRIRILKRELTESITALSDQAQFFVFFFNSDVIPIAEKVKWIIANQQGKRWTVDRLYNIQPFGGTEPWGAFEMAFAMKPQPDAIYFLTDGEFDPLVAQRIALTNVGSRKIPIHCITLVEKSGEETMRKIAADSGGSYIHVPGTK